MAALLIAAVAVSSVLLVNRDGSETGDAGEGSRQSGAPATAVIGVDGGRVDIPGSDESGAGIALEVPADALSDDTELTVSAVPGPAGKLVDLAEDDTAVWSALAAFALDDEDTLVHPVFGPVVMASLTELTGPVIEFGPSGLELEQPVEVSVPLELVDLPEGTFPVVLLEGEDGWEVIEDVTVDVGADVLRFDVSHFSRSIIGRIAGNVWSNPTASVSRDQYRAALDTLSAGPAGAEYDGVLRAILCRDGIAFNSTAVPDAGAVLDYLGFEAGRISLAPADAGRRIRGVLQQRLVAARAAGNPEPHDFSFNMLLELSLNETNGDPFQALVLAHDILRDNRNSPYVQNVMVNVRGDSGDEQGARYHILGTAVYSFAYEHLRATDRTGIFWPPRPESVIQVEEAWVSGDIRTDTVEYAVDRLGARLGRDLYREYASIASGQRSEYVQNLCANAASSTTTTATTTTETSTGETTTSLAEETTTSTVPPDIVLGQGDIQATLLWSGDSDMDLHVLDPNGEEIFYSSPSSSSGGTLDQDDIPTCGSGTGSHVENVFWPPGEAPSGEYRSYVHFFAACSDGVSQSVQLTVRVNGQVVVSQAITLTAGATSDLFPVTIS